MGQALTPVVLHMKQSGNQNQYQKKRQTVFCYLDMMQTVTSHLQHLVYHNTPTWLIQFYDRQYQMLYISLKNATRTCAIIDWSVYLIGQEEKSMDGWMLWSKTKLIIV